MFYLSLMIASILAANDQDLASTVKTRSLRGAETEGSLWLEADQGHRELQGTCRRRGAGRCVELRNGQVLDYVSYLLGGNVEAISLEDCESHCVGLDCWGFFHRNRNQCSVLFQGYLQSRHEHILAAFPNARMTSERRDTTGSIIPRTASAPINAYEPTGGNCYACQCFAPNGYPIPC